MKNDQITINIDHTSINARAYRLIGEENEFNPNFNNDYNINEKLKAIILLVISQNIDIDKIREYNQQKREKVYLMNYKFLLEYKYDEITSLLKENNNDIQSLIEQLNNPKYPYDSNIFKQILSNLKKEKLLKINNEFENIEKPKTPWEAKTIIIKLKNKNINVYKEFILVNEKIFNEIRIKLSLYSLKKEIFYTYNNGDIISINDNNQNFILFGHINNETHLYSLRYILDFDKDSYLLKELSIIQKNGIENYMKEKTVFSEGDNKDLISPIFADYYEIGTFYIYSNGTDYSQLRGENYEIYLNKGNFAKIMNLYNFYSNFKQNLEKSYSENKYLLINKNIMNSIKKDYNYDTFIQMLNKFNPNEKNEKKKKLFILKNLPEDLYENFIKSYQSIEKYDKDFVHPQQYTFNIPDSDKSVNIYKDFEIVNSTTAIEFIDGIYGQGYEYKMKEEENYIDCSSRDGKIIIYYPKYKFNNEYHVYEIGNLNNENTFIPEYLIIYKKDHSKFSDIKYKLNNYLQSLEENYVNGVYPITTQQRNNFGEYDFEEIGKVICLSKINDNSLFISNTGTGQNMNIDYDFNTEIHKDNKYKEPSDTPHKSNTGIFPKKLSPYIIKEYNLNAKPQNLSINQNFIIPPLIGLDNIGATCYMNATLQCLCNIPKFVNYFKYNNHLIEKVRTDLSIDNKTLSSSFKLLIEKLWPDRLYFANDYKGYPSIGSNNTYSNKINESYAPNEFKERISSMNELFKGVAANDAKDLVQFLIMTLHKELNMAKNQNMGNNAFNQNQTNKQLMFNLFTQDFINSNKSIISDLFYGVNYNVIQCSCGVSSYNYQTYFFFVFPLEEVRIFKNQNNFNNNFNNFNNNMNINNNEINIYDCFCYEQKITYMTGQNAMYCNYCKNTCNSQMCTYLAFGPEIIIIILNRGQGIQFNVKINFFETLNLYNFIEFKETGVNYQLIGVITHTGGSDMSGHFIAYCKSPISNSWFQFNDAVVNEVDQAHFKEKVIDYAMPYLLFYQKMK